MCIQSMRRSTQPQRLVYQAVGDALHAQQRDTAFDDALSLLSTKTHRENFPAPVAHFPTAFEKHATAIHESAHAVSVIPVATSIALKLGENGGGECRITGVEKLEDKINFALAGVMAEAKFHPASIHKYTSGACYDFLVARLLIDQLNDEGGQIRLTYRSAAKRAMVLVDSCWLAITNVALALNDSGELDDCSIRLFARCQR
jgi:hypothetical protein